MNRRLAVLAFALAAVAVAPNPPIVSPAVTRPPSQFKTERDKRRAEKRRRKGVL